MFFDFLLSVVKIVVSWYNSYNKISAMIMCLYKSLTVDLNEIVCDVVVWYVGVGVCSAAVCASWRKYTHVLLQWVSKINKYVCKVKMGIIDVWIFLHS
jgi:hypothetical protein